MHEISTTTERQLDITGEPCPMTFVRTRLQLDRMNPGEVLRVRFRGDEPRRNLARSLAEQGFGVLEVAELPDGEGMLRIRKPEPAAA